MAHGENTHKVIFNASSKEHGFSVNLFFEFANPDQPQVPTEKQLQSLDTFLKAFRSTVVGGMVVSVEGDLSALEQL